MEPVLSYCLDCFSFDDAVFSWIGAIKFERFLQGDGWIGDDARVSQTVDRHRVNHQGMEKNHVAHFTGHFVKFVTFLDYVVVEIFEILLGLFGPSRNHVRRHAFGMIILFFK